MCPDRYIWPETWSVMELSELFWKGLAPVSGGVLEQAAIFISAARFVRAETELCKAKLKRRVSDE